MQVLIKLLLILVHVLWCSILDGPRFRIRPTESPQIPQTSQISISLHSAA